MPCLCSVSSYIIVLPQESLRHVFFFLFKNFKLHWNSESNLKFFCVSALVWVSRIHLGHMFPNSSGAEYLLSFHGDWVDSLRYSHLVFLSSSLQGLSEKCLQVTTIVFIKPPLSWHLLLNNQLTNKRNVLSLGCNKSWKNEWFSIIWNYELGKC